MKKIFYLFLIYISCCLFISCEDSSSSSDNNNNSTSNFSGKWVENEALDELKNDVGNYYYQYCLLYSEYDIYSRQGVPELAIEKYKEIENLHDEYKDHYAGYCTIIEIRNGAIKIGEGKLYINPTNNNLWLKKELSRYRDLKITFGIEIKNWWSNYYYTINGDMLYFDNNRGLFKKGTLVWDGDPQYYTLEDYIK